MRDLYPSHEDYPAVRSTAAAEPAGSRRLLADGGEEQSADEGGERTEESDSDESEGGDEEMAPPEQEGEAGVEEGEEEESEEAEAEETEAEKEEETEAEEPQEAAAEEVDEEEGVVDVPQSDVESVGATEDESTTVLFLDLYGLDLDVLGLEIELHQLVLDVFATEGDGNLLGNLLSAVAGLTDPGGLSNLVPDVSEMMPEGGLSGLLPGGDSIKNAVGLGDQEGEGGAEGDEDGKEGDGFLSSTARTLRDSVPSLPVKQLLIEVIAGVIKQLLEPSEKESGEDASGEGS